ncbi:MAG: type II toxin-antitoxin system RelE/ParE family toxin [Acetobacteraceae bacterium]
MKTRTITYTVAALVDISAMQAWLTQPGAAARARRRMVRILAAIDGLADHPCRFAVGSAGVCEFTCEGYRIVYRVLPDTGRDETAGDVQLLRLFGPGQLRM